MATDRRSRSVSNPSADKDADLYAVLGVRPSADADEIQRAYRGKARELHPDVNRAPDATARFAELQQAYEVISDPVRRRVYDARGVVTTDPPDEPVIRHEPTYAWEGIGTRRRDDDPARTRRGGDAHDPTGFEELYLAFFAPRVKAAKPSTPPGPSA